MKRIMGFFLLLVLMSIACGLPQSAAAPTQTPQVVTVVVEATPAPTQTGEPTLAATATTAAAAATATQPGPTATTAPQCTVQRTLNFRRGPGTAYNPPLKAFAAGEVVVPQGYNSPGIPGGAWVQVLDPANNQVGWVSAGTDFVVCTIDVTGLPSVAVQPPPPPQRPSVSNSQPDGSADRLIGDFIYSPDFLLRLAVRVEDTDNDGDGIKEVVFTVVDTATDRQIYQRVEGTAGFCIFGGGEPTCNPWPVTNYVITWGDGGPAVVDGVYNVRMAAEGDNDESGNWNFDLTVDVP